VNTINVKNGGTNKISPQGITSPIGDTIHPCGTTSPLGVKVKNGPLYCPEASDEIDDRKVFSGKIVKKRTWAVFNECLS
jgi:hypothetical protein